MRKVKVHRWNHIDEDQEKHYEVRLPIHTGSKWDVIEDANDAEHAVIQAIEDYVCDAGETIAYVRHQSNRKEVKKYNISGYIDYIILDVKEIPIKRRRRYGKNKGKKRRTR